MSSKHDPRTEIVEATVTGLYRVPDFSFPGVEDALRYSGGTMVVTKVSAAAIARRKPPLEPGWQEGVNAILAHRSETMWKMVKDALQAPDGDRYFQDGLRDALFPAGAYAVEFIRAKVTGVNAGATPPYVDLTLFRGDAAEIRLLLPHMSKKAVSSILSGSDLAFRGIATAFTRDPFLVTMTTRKGDVQTGPEFKLWRP